MIKNHSGRIRPVKNIHKFVRATGRISPVILTLLIFMKQKKYRMKTKKIIYQIILMGVFIAILSGCKNDEDSIGSMELTGTTWTSDNGKYCIGFTTSNSAIRYDSNLGIKRGVYTIQNDHIFLDLGGGNIVDMIYENKAITGIEEKLFVLSIFRCNCATCFGDVVPQKRMTSRPKL